MELKELKNKSVSELETLLTVERLKLKDLRFKDANKQLKDVRQIRENKKLLAQILTILNAKRQQAQ